MKNDLLKAKEILINNNYTCVLYSDGIEFHSDKHGVKPLIDFLESGQNFSGFSAADKIVGQGAAHLYVLLGVKAVWANIISKGGKNILEENNISVFYEKTIPFIINRAGDGVCPIENCVNGISCSEQAFSEIKHTLSILTK